MATKVNKRNQIKGKEKKSLRTNNKNR